MSPPPAGTDPAAAATGASGPVATAASPQTHVPTVFAGLMLGMFLAAINQTIVAPAMPRIVADLGGMGHYSWIAVSSLLAATVAVPIVGKLSDLFGRKAFYVGGIVLFMLSSLVAGVAPTLEIFLVARVLEGLGMGTMMPLSQAIIGDLVAPRDRGKYQGLMGAMFGLASVIGPFVGGGITDNWGWRWLFFANLPLAAIALLFIIPFMHLPQRRREPVIDYAGFLTLTLALVSLLLAITLGGSDLAWTSPPILGLFVVGAAALAGFVAIERRAAEPVLPPRLWRNGIFTASNLAVMCVAMAMFGAIYYIPLFVQGVLGASVTGSGAVLTPMMLSIVALSTFTGLMISKTGRYKLPLLLGICTLGVGVYLLTRMDLTTSYREVVRNMILIGLGLGASMQTFVLIVQNAVGRADLGVATATTQLFRSIGASAGTAILGTILANGLTHELQHSLSPAQVALIQASGGEVGAAAVIDPQSLAELPPEVLQSVRAALAAALQPVFSVAFLFVAVALLAASCIREIPLRRTLEPEPAETGKELLAELGHAGADDGGPVLGKICPAYRERTAHLGALYAHLAQSAATNGDHLLKQLVQQLGGGDPQAGLQRLQAVARALQREGDEELAPLPPTPPSDLLPSDLPGDLDCEQPGELDCAAALQRVLDQRSAELPHRLQTLAAGEQRQPTAVLTPDDLETLERAAVILSVAMRNPQRR